MTEKWFHSQWLLPQNKRSKNTTYTIKTANKNWEYVTKDDMDELVFLII